MATKTTEPSFEFIIEVGLDQLVEVCDPDLALNAKDTSLEVFYGCAIISFLRGENDQLQILIQSIATRFQDHPEREFLETACLLRKTIRERTYDSSLIERADLLTSRESRWTGELAMLLATAYTTFENYPRALSEFVRAAKALEQLGCLKKSLRARMNVLVCESHLYPTRNLLSRYHDLYRRALRNGNRELIVATTCLLNMSREYQQAGAMLAALKMCNRALALFELNMGDMNYFLTLAHRAHVLCELGRHGEARIDYESAKLAPFKEVQAALKVVETLLNQSNGGSINHSDDLLPTWRERSIQSTASSGQAEAKKRLSALEEKLIVYLTDGPKDRVDILETIYGASLDHETKLNRFKSLLSTLRKKHPSLIICEAGTYRLADELLVPQISTGA